MGKVIQILSERNEMTELLLDIDHPIKKAINYNNISGKVSVGDQLYLNTTAATLSLGTGGYHFVIANMAHSCLNMSPGGHGMKLRYTPMQVKVPFVEEENISMEHIFNNPLKLTNKLICFGELHSMVPPLCAFFKYYAGEAIRIAYIMTDHAALPIQFSNNIAYLKECKLVNATITTGNAFGGDYECVNIYTALQTAALLASCDVIIISMGPGITGTSTKYGFSSLEMSFYMDLVFHLGGNCCYVPRISFADKRDRHYGLSHHSLTVLGEILEAPMHLALPIMDKIKLKIIMEQLRVANVLNKHNISLNDGSSIKAAMDYFALNTSTMGRGIKDDPYFFYSIGAAGRKGLSLI